MRISEASIKKLLRDRGMTIKTFGSKLGITRQGVYHLLSRKHVKEEMVDRISKALSVDSKEFLVTENVTPREANGMPELEKEVLRLRESVADKNRLIAAQEKVMKMQEHLIGTLNKKVASIVHPKSRHS